jgi:hypothetical protein
VGFAFATGVFLMQGAVNWVRGERLLTCMFLFSVARLVFGVVVVSRRILNDNRPRGISGQGDDVAGRGEGFTGTPGESG